MTQFRKEGSKEQFGELQVSKSNIDKAVKNTMKTIPLAKDRIIEHLEEHDRLRRSKYGF